MSAIVDGLDGGSKSEPFTLDEPTPSAPAQPDMSDMGNGGGLAAALAAQAAKLKSVSEAAPLREKREDEMSFAEQIAHQREKIRLKAEAEAAKAAEAE